MIRTVCKYNVRDEVRIYLYDTTDITPYSRVEINRYNVNMRFEFITHTDSPYFQLTNVKLYTITERGTLCGDAIEIMLYLPLDENGIFCPEKIALYEMAKYLSKLGK